MLPPIVMALALNKLSVRSILIFLSVACALGQALFAIGLQKKDFGLCLLGRFFIGMSDAQTIM